MKQHGSLEKDEEATRAAWEAAQGAVVGAAKWGAFFAVAGTIAQVYYRPYRSLTIPFKTYIQMSGMVMGGYLEADRRMGQYARHMRHQKRLARDMEIWKQYEASYEDKGTPGVGAESHVHDPNGK